MKHPPLVRRISLPNKVIELDGSQHLDQQDYDEERNI
jgi:very-short-patch-repair endonuclease